MKNENTGQKGPSDEYSISIGSKKNTFCSYIAVTFMVRDDLSEACERPPQMFVSEYP